MTDAPAQLEVLPTEEARSVRERIGTREWTLTEVMLDVHEDVALWADNPRLQTAEMEGFSSEVELENELRTKAGYDALRKSIKDVGQMQSIYVKRTSTGKHLVLEGATRVTALRELDRQIKGGKQEGIFRRVRAKLLPPEFTESDIAILLAGIHVRGTMVRSWGRYIEAKFIYETVAGRPGSPALMNQATLAENMGRTAGWLSKLKGAYEFALKFIEHLEENPDPDEPNPRKLAAEKFSILEEISKARVVGPQLRDFYNADYDELREDVFEMVRKGVFKEYRDARFLKDFYDNEEAWDQLKTGERDIANKLAKEISNQGNTPKSRISSLPQTVKRAMERDAEIFDEDDINSLQQAIDLIADKVHEGVSPYRIAIRKAAMSLNKASRAGVQDLEQSDIKDLREAFEYFDGLVAMYAQGTR